MENLLTSKIVFIGDKINSRRNAFLDSLGLTVGHGQFLITLAANDGMTMGMIADAIGSGAPSTTKFAIKLEQIGLIRREASRIDSRQNHAFITENGSEIAAQIVSAYKDIDSEITTSLKSKGHDRMLGLTDKIANALAGKKIAAKKPKKAGKSPKSNKKKSKKAGKSKSGGKKSSAAD